MQQFCNNNTREPQQPRFQGIRTLSSGPEGLLQLALDRMAQKHVAIRYLPRDSLATTSGYKYVVREVLNHRQLSLCKHPHLLEFKQVILTPRYLGIVMEHFPGQDLQSYLVAKGGRLPEPICRVIFQQCMLALEFVHTKGKVLRDIKLESILLDDSGLIPLIKLRAFHLSKDRVHDSAPVTQCGTALFSAPEVFLNVTGQPYDGQAVDIWSCGVILYMMLFGTHPFLPVQANGADGHSEADVVTRLIENMVRGQLYMPAWAEGTLAADLLRRMLVPAPKQRYRLKDVMAHPWFQVDLPPGALELNSACMMHNHEADMAQSAATVQQMITLAYEQTQQAQGGAHCAANASPSRNSHTSASASALQSAAAAAAAAAAASQVTGRGQLAATAAAAAADVGAASGLQAVLHRPRSSAGSAAGDDDAVAAAAAAAAAVAAAAEAMGFPRPGSLPLVMGACPGQALMQVLGDRDVLQALCLSADHEAMQMQYGQGGYRC